MSEQINQALPPEIPPYTIVGPDISFYDNNIETRKGIDFKKMLSVSYFVIIRAGQNLWVDRDIDVNWHSAKQAGIPRGSYWFYDSRADPKRQAELWVQSLKGDLGELPMFLDLEDTYRGRYNSWRDWYVFLEYLKLLVGKKEIGIYTGYYYFKDHGPNRYTQRQSLDYFRQYPLWIANYSAIRPLIPPPWGRNEWLLWQFTARGDGIAYGAESKGIDLNYFNGSLKNFNKRFKLPSQPSLTDMRPIILSPEVSLEEPGEFEI